MTNEYSLDSTTLKQRIIAMPEDRILFRSDYPEYHTEFVGSILSELTAEGILVKIAQGIYAKQERAVSEWYYLLLIRLCRLSQLVIMQRYYHLV